MTDTSCKLVDIFRKPVFLIPLLLAVVMVGYFAYVAWAFPETRCEAKTVSHLNAPDQMSDCYGCHVKVTARVAQEWYESKHGINLVRCAACHGEPDGKGSIAFSRTPHVSVCASCHSLSINRMEAKFGKRDDCASCHPNHASPMHGEAYVYRQDAQKP